MDYLICRLTLIIRNVDDIVVNQYSTVESQHVTGGLPAIPESFIGNPNPVPILPTHPNEQAWRVSRQ